MYEEFLYKRLSELRTQKGVSARDMSLSLGQSDSYINKIENQKALPSMYLFFYICEYLGVHPKDFFDESTRYPVLLNEAMRELSKLSESQLMHMIAIAQDISEPK